MLETCVQYLSHTRICLSIVSLNFSMIGDDWGDLLRDTL